MEESYDVVYYTRPTPSSWGALTLLGLVFDRIHFPGVYVGTDGLDPERAANSIERLRSNPRPRSALGGPTSHEMINCLILALNHEYLKDFCVFPGKFGYAGTLEDGAEALAAVFEELVYGPPPPGFHPALDTGFAVGLRGNETASVNGPSWLSYPGNAVLYASRLGLPYVNDDPQVPMLAPGGLSPKNNSKLLSTILAVESVRLVLPKLKPPRAPELRDFREEMRPHVKPFRRAMLRLTKSVNDAITSDADTAEVQKAAQFVAETEVRPALEDLRGIIEEPARPWYRRAVDAAAAAPELVSGFSELPPSALAVKLLSLIVGALADEADAKRRKTEAAHRVGLNFLLKLDARLRVP